MHGKNSPWNGWLNKSLSLFANLIYPRSSALSLLETGVSRLAEFGRILNMPQSPKFLQIRLPQNLIVTK